MGGDGSVNTLLDRYRDRQDVVEKFVAAYQQYCWSVESLDDLKLAPFHLLATEGKVHADRDHQFAEQVAQTTAVQTERRRRQADHGRVGVLVQNPLISLGSRVVTFIDDNEFRIRLVTADERLD